MSPPHNLYGKNYSGKLGQLEATEVEKQVYPKIPVSAGESKNRPTPMSPWKTISAKYPSIQKYLSSHMEYPRKTFSLKNF